jgi:excisionase family DNA binding protein
MIQAAHEVIIRQALARPRHEQLQRSTDRRRGFYKDCAASMKLPPTQFGVRENTASSRQHTSRLAASESPLRSHAPSGIQGSADDAKPPATLPTEMHVPSQPKDTNKTTGGAAITFQGRRRHRRNRDEESISAPMTAMEDLVDIREAAQFLAVSVSTLYGWIWQRKISFIKVGRAVRFDMADLRRFVEENRIHASAGNKL